MGLYGIREGFGGEAAKTFPIYSIAKTVIASEEARRTWRSVSFQRHCDPDEERNREKQSNLLHLRVQSFAGFDMLKIGQIAL